MATNKIRKVAGILFSKLYTPEYYMRKRRMTVSFNTTMGVRMKGINNIITVLQSYNSSLKIKCFNGMVVL